MKNSSNQTAPGTAREETPTHEVRWGGTGAFSCQRAVGTLAQCEEYLALDGEDDLSIHPLPEGEQEAWADLLPEGGAL